MDEPTRNVAVTFAILPYGSLENWAVGQSKRSGWPTGPARSRAHQSRSSKEVTSGQPPNPSRPQASREEELRAGSIQAVHREISGGRWPGAAAIGSGSGVRDGSGAGEKAYKKCEGLRLPLPLAYREEGEGGTRGHRGASGISLLPFTVKPLP
jgi:hypothetical protein